MFSSDCDAAATVVVVFVLNSAAAGPLAVDFLSKPNETFADSLIYWNAFITGLNLHRTRVELSKPERATNPGIRKSGIEAKAALFQQ